MASRLRLLLLLGVLGAGCGQDPEPTSPEALASSSPETADTPAPPPARAEGAYRLVIRAEVPDDVAPPHGYRILRLPPRLEDFPPGAQIDRREVQKGKWREYPGAGQELIIDLEPTADVIEDRWMVVAYRQNDLHGFRYADNGFRRIEVGTSEVFQLSLDGGERELTIPIRSSLRVQPSFAFGGENAGPFAFEFGYGPIAASPRRVRGDWSGSGPLPVEVSRYAVGREGFLTLHQAGWPSEVALGPVEMELEDAAVTTVTCPPPIPVGPLAVAVAPREEPSAVWGKAEVLGGFRGDGGEWTMAPAGVTDDAGLLTLPDAQEGRYHLSARHEDGRILLGWVAHNGERTEAPIDIPANEETGRLDLVNLPDAEDWEVQVWSYWGALLVGRRQGKPDADLTLPHIGEMRHVALATRYDAAEEITHAHLYLECEWDGGAWHFHADPTVFEIDSFTDELGLVLRLLRPDDPEPEQYFPPRAWQVEPGQSATLDHFPVSFRGGLTLFGLPEGQYEAGIWGVEPATGRMAELATFWPVAETVLED